MNETGTRIRKGLRLRGEMVADEDVSIEGEFTGNIAAGGRVTVEAGGLVKGDITAANLILLGTLEGSATVADRFELRRPGRMLGDIKASVVAIDDKTFLRGRVLATQRMTTDIKSLRRRIRAANAVTGRRRAALARTGRG